MFLGKEFAAKKLYFASWSGKNQVTLFREQSLIMTRKEVEAFQKILRKLSNPHL